MFMNARRLTTPAPSLQVKSLDMAAAFTVPQSQPQRILRLDSFNAISNTKGLRGVSFVMSMGLRSGARSSPRLQISCIAAEPATLEKVQQVIANQLSVDATAVVPDAKFADLGADSLDTVEIMMNLEEKFQISIAEDGANNIVTVGDAANMIQELISKQD